jgi:hypothetical protein
MEIMKLHRLTEKNLYRGVVVCTTEEEVSVVSESELLVLFVSLDGKNPARDILERHKVV